MISSTIPDLAGLEVLDAIAEHGSMTAAATALGITQQAASLRIRSMEREIGLRLLFRSTRGSALTPAGAQLHALSRNVLADVRDLAVGVASLREQRPTRLRIASSLTIAEHLLPTWLVGFARERTRRELPAANIELTAINSEAVAERVRNGLADVGFVEGPSEPVGLHAQVVAHDELVVIVGPAHPWAGRRDPVSAGELADTPLVQRETGSGSQLAFDQAMAAALPAAHLRAAPALEVSTAAAVLAAVAAGAGPAAVSSLAIADDLTLHRIAVVPTSGLDLRRSLRATWRGNRPPSGMTRDLLAVTGS